MRVLQSVLDRGTLEDLGVSEFGPGNPRAPTAPFGSSFTVTNADAADVVIEVNACEGLYEFGAKITYVEAGEPLTAMVGSAEKPFRIVGGWRGVERFHRAPIEPNPDDIRPGPLPFYPGAALSDGVPESTAQFCA
ncbi:hypothetical protein [Allorhizocola rhizosphaerae]|uniref:hypothetical protein n=1 Tax=Allorhizocola rhizosphaerae TaxID=1872709 RepID=UPI0013C333A1|nr:hypothetical protein [Allorhizocola rhizosphaerae]